MQIPAILTRLARDPARGHYLIRREEDGFCCTCGIELGKYHATSFFVHLATIRQIAKKTEAEEPTLFELVKSDLDERDAKGWREYGKAMRLDVSKDYLKEAYEESLDQVMYLKGELLKRELQRNGQKNEPQQ